MFRSKLKLFKSLDTLKILTFWKILQTDNILLLDSGYFEGKRYNKREQNDIKEVWERLYDEYYLLRNDGKSKRELEKAFESNEVKWKLKCLDTSIRSFMILKSVENTINVDKLYQMRKEMYDTLKLINKRIKFNHFSSIQEDIDYVKKFYVSMQNTYNLNYKPKDKVYKSQIDNVYKVVANVESWLDGKTLDIDNIVVSHWLAYEEQVINKQKKDGK